MLVSQAVAPEALSLLGSCVPECLTLQESDPAVLVPALGRLKVRALALVRDVLVVALASQYAFGVHDEVAVVCGVSLELYESLYLLADSAVLPLVSSEPSAHLAPHLVPLAAELLCEPSLCGVNLLVVHSPAPPHAVALGSQVGLCDLGVHLYEREVLVLAPPVHLRVPPRSVLVLGAVSGLEYGPCQVSGRHAVSFRLKTKHGHLLCYVELHSEPSFWLCLACRQVFALIAKNFSK